MDAAVATGFSLAAVEPWNSGFGGVGFGVVGLGVVGFGVLDCDVELVLDFDDELELDFDELELLEELELPEPTATRTAITLRANISGAK